MRKPGRSSNLSKSRALELFRSNRLPEARQLLEKVCARNSKDLESWLTLAIINRRLGQHRDSEYCCRKILTVHPDSSAALLHLGAALQCQGKIDQAIESYEASIKSTPNNPEAYYFLGNILREYKSVDESIPAYKKAVELSPQYREALSNLGAALTVSGNTREALKYLQQAHRLAPRNTFVLSNLAEAHLFENNLSNALQFINKALNFDWNFVNAHLIKGRILRKAGNFESALSSFNRTLELSPDNSEAASGAAEILEARGECSKAATYISPLVDKGVTETDVLINYATLAPHTGQIERSIKLLEQKLQNPHLPAPESILIHYKLGKLLDQRKRYDSAFHHYKKANDISLTFNTKEPDPYDSDRLLPRMLNWANNLSLQEWHQLPRSSCQRQPIFVIGMPRSGTTLVEQILASHPRVYGAGELHDIHNYAKSLPRRLKTDLAYPDCLDLVTEDTLNRFATEHYKKLSSLSSDAECFVDKLPYNFLHLPLIELLFPNCYIIHTRRNALDTCLSIYFQAFSTDMPSTNSLDTIGKYYCNYWQLVENWRNKFNINTLDLAYEDVIEDPEKSIGDLLGFCDLEWNDNCLSFHRTDRDVNTPSYDQVRQPLYSSSVNRWKHYEKYLSSLIKMVNSCD